MLQEPPDSKLDSRDLQEVDEAPRPDPLKQPASRDGTPRGLPRQQPLVPPGAGALHEPQGQPLIAQGPALPEEIAYLAALSQYGKVNPQMALQMGLSAQPARTPQGTQPPGNDEQEMATRRFAEHLQQQQLPSGRGSQPPPGALPLKSGHGLGAAQDGRSAAPKGDGPHLPAFLQPGHSLTAHLPAAPTLQASEDRFPHNPDLDPFLSSLQQSQQLMLSNVAEHRQPTNWDPPGQPASGFEAAGHSFPNEALRMCLDSPLFASNQAAAAAAAAAADAAAAAASYSDRRAPQPPSMHGAQSGVAGSHDHAFKSGGDPRDLHRRPMEDTAGFHRQLQDHWQQQRHLDSLPTHSRMSARGPAEAAIEAARHAQLMDRARLETGLQQQALLDAALHREPGVGGPQMPFSEEEIRLHALQDHLATSGSFLFPGSLLPPFKTPRDQNRHPPVIETQAARAFDAALQGGRFHEEQQGSDHLPPPRHLFGSFLGQEHSEAARGRWAPQGPELESLRRAAEWMGGAAQQPSSQRAMHEGEADARGMQPGRAAASDISGAMLNLQPGLLHQALRVMHLGNCTCLYLPPPPPPSPPGGTHTHCRFPHLAADKPTMQHFALLALQRCHVTARSPRHGFTWQAS